MTLNPGPDKKETQYQDILLAQEGNPKIPRSRVQEILVVNRSQDEKPEAPRNKPSVIDVEGV